MPSSTSFETIATDQRQVEGAEQEDGVAQHHVGQGESGKVVGEVESMLGHRLGEHLLRLGEMEEEEDHDLHHQEGAEAKVGPLAGEELEQFRVELAAE